MHVDGISGDYRGRDSRLVRAVEPIVETKLRLYLQKEPYFPKLESRSTTYNVKGQLVNNIRNQIDVIA